MTLDSESLLVLYDTIMKILKKLFNVQCSMFNVHGMLFLETYMDLEARGLVELETKSIKKNIQHTGPKK